MKNHMYPERSVQSGCKGCKVRHLGCHIDCENYISFKNELAAIRKKRVTENMIRITLAENEYHRKRTNIREN